MNCLSARIDIRNADFKIRTVLEIKQNVCWKTLANVNGLQRARSILNMAWESPRDIWTILIGHLPS